MHHPTARAGCPLTNTNKQPRLHDGYEGASQVKKVSMPGSADRTQWIGSRRASLPPYLPVLANIPWTRMPVRSWIHDLRLGRFRKHHTVLSLEKGSKPGASCDLVLPLFHVAWHP